MRAWTGVIAALAMAAAAALLPAETTASPHANVLEISGTAQGAGVGGAPGGVWLVRGRVQLPESKNKPFLDPAVYVPLLVVLLTLAGGYLNNVRLEQRKARLSFINEQLKCLYGPLSTLSGASAAAWDKFRQKYRPDGAYFSSTPPPNPDELRVWREWVKLVFAPMNDEMVRVIVSNGHLLATDAMPKSFEDLIAHAEAYRVVIKRWEAGDYTEHTSLFNFPRGLEKEVKDSFSALSREQRRLMKARI